MEMKDLGSVGMKCGSNHLLHEFMDIHVRLEELMLWINQFVGSCLCLLLKNKICILYKIIHSGIIVHVLCSI